MAIVTYQPEIQVILLKMVKRTDGVAARYTAAQRQIDLTPWLGDYGVVRTSKGIAEPAGVFTVVLTDKMHIDVMDSLYAFIEPMDVIEIRGSHSPEVYAGGPLPLLMRGYVSSVRRSESIGEDGAPARSVVVSGHDAGKLWQIHNIWFEVAYATEHPMLSAFLLQAVSGLTPKLTTLSEFITEFTETVMNQKIADMAAFADRIVQPFIVDSSVTQGQIVPQMIAQYQGDMWGIITRYAERPWNEIFVEDSEDGPVLVFRPAPFKGIDGKWIGPAVDPGTIDVALEDVVGIDVERTDAQVANFFWVPPGPSMLDSNYLVNVAALQAGQPFDTTYGNDSPALYGLKKMEVGTFAIPTDIDELPTEAPLADQPAGGVKYVAWHQKRMELLKAMNRDNVVFEAGAMQIRGNEDWKPGRYLRLTRGDVVSEAYVVSVEHAITPLQSWTTTLSFERGTGFLVRNKMPNSPYLAEGRPGVYP
jgi:hypothetical protein